MTIKIIQKKKKNENKEIKFWLKMNILGLGSEFGYS
jgi:hypothetical protein